MQWCKGVLPWKSCKFTSAPNCSNSSIISGLPFMHARCNNEQPWRHFPESLKALILWQAAGSYCLFSAALELNLECGALLTWWYNSMSTASSYVVLMILESEIAIKRYASCKLFAFTACQILDVWERLPDTLASLMTSNFSTYCHRATKISFVYHIITPFEIQKHIRQMKMWLLLVGHGFSR